MRRWDPRRRGAGGWRALTLVALVGMMVLCTGLIFGRPVGDRIVGVVTHGSAEGQFLAVVAAVDERGEEAQRTAVRFRQVGDGPAEWALYGQFAAAARGLAERRGDLAILLEFPPGDPPNDEERGNRGQERQDDAAGDDALPEATDDGVAVDGAPRTQLRFMFHRPGTLTRPQELPAPRPPAGVRWLALADGPLAGQVVLLGARREGEVERLGVWRLLGEQWQELAALPDEAAWLDPAQVDLAATGRRPTLAARTGEAELTIWQWYAPPAPPLVRDQPADPEEPPEPDAEAPHAPESPAPGSPPEGDAGPSEAADYGEWRPVGSLQLAPEERFALVGGAALQRPIVHAFAEGDRLVRFDPGGDLLEATVDFTRPDHQELPWTALAPAAEDPRAGAEALGSIRIVRAIRVGEGESRTLVERVLDLQTLEPVGDAEILEADQPRDLGALTLLIYVLLALAIILVLRQRPQSADMEQMRETARRAAPLLPRLLAGLIDGTPLLALLLAWPALSPLLSESAQIVVAAAVIALYLVHMTVAEGVTGRSAGKAIFGLKVVRATGEDAGWWAVLVRNVLRPLDILPLGLPLLLAAFTPLRQRLGDLAAGTVVVTTGEPPARDSEPGTDR